MTAAVGTAATLVMMVVLTAAMGATAAFMMVMLAVVVTLDIGIEIQPAGQEGLHSRVCAAGDTAI